IRALGKERIACFHFHDVDLINDNHTFPFVEKIDWDLVTKAIKDVGYKGTLTFEADAFMVNYPNELLESCLNLLLDTGRYLANKIEN
ncbi:MAG: hypothetical protein MJ066_05150, partial [Clostridia bacterium]|nr:hypothetical protein [Clostridia bacterium]